MGICPSCGKSNAVHARFCQSCGTALSGDAPEQQPPSAQEERREQPREEPRYIPDQSEYGGFWERVVAAVIDGLVVFVATGIVTAAAIGFPPFGFPLGVITGWLYESLLTASEKQATLGKMAMGLVVTDENRQRLTFARATGRHFAKYLSLLTLGIGYIMVAFTDRRQGLHDLVAATLVVRNSK
jgi:uncharacterized RDD family membrane protein YckC